MDGGGRLVRPLSAGVPGGAAVATSPRSQLPSIRFLRFLARPRFRRGRSVAVPLERRLPRFLGTGLVFGFLGLAGGTGLVLGGHVQALRQTYGEPHHILARAVGLGIERVTIVGIAALTEAEVLNAAGISPRVSLPFLSVRETRERLEALPLVKSASVRKLYPDELVVTFDEPRFAYLPLVVGEQANLHTRDYLALIEAAGPLKRRIRAGTLVSGRRWTLKMDNGLDVRLPEHGAKDALLRLIKLEREQGILQKDVIAIDLRMPDRVVVRLTEEAAATRLDSLKKKPMRGKGVET